MDVFTHEFFTKFNLITSEIMWVLNVFYMSISVVL